MSIRNVCQNTALPGRLPQLVTKNAGVVTFGQCSSRTLSVDKDAHERIAVGRQPRLRLPQSAPTPSLTGDLSLTGPPATGTPWARRALTTSVAVRFARHRLSLVLGKWQHPLFNVASLTALGLPLLLWQRAERRSIPMVPPAFTQPRPGHQVSEGLRGALDRSVLG